MKQIAPFLVMIVMLAVIAVVISTLTNYHLKKRILDNGPLNEHAMRFLGTIPEFNSEILKWGVILLFGGIGLIFLEFIPHSKDSPLPYGVETVFIGAGFLTYYLIQKKKK